MEDEFQYVREVVSGRSLPPVDPPRLTTAANVRLLRALGQTRPPTSVQRVGSGDLAALVRHALRTEQERQGGMSPSLSVPRSAPWPAHEAWELFGVEVIGEAGDLFQVRARPWRPRWLAGASDDPPDGPACGEAWRRDYGEPPTPDPFLDRFEKWRAYRSAGQREAVRATLTAPAGSSLIVNLPTGSGKSLCVQLPSLLDEHGLTVVVVPITALAVDQQRALRDHVSHPTAYVGGTDRVTIERNRDIRERIRRGSQRIVFTSPESLVRTSLAGAVQTAARHGLLRYLAIDEAHIVDQWGDEFRSEFQELAGLRRDLMRGCPSPDSAFRTILLTGTMTARCYDTLETLFGQPGPLGVVSAVQLRPEPSYWSHEAGDEGARQDRVLEAIRHLPRPLLLYATKVKDALDWARRLQAHGFLRTAVVTGRSTTAERDAVVRHWQANDLDIIVATSAFGLGMDKGDVRAVVHACIPEHIDRFYQEVGRGGRDGAASLSLILSTPADRDVARKLSRRTIISIRKGFERWKSMFHDDSREELPDGRLRVSVDVVPSYGLGRFENSRRNLAWNVRTLTLLSRARVIELDAEQLGTPQDGATDDPQEEQRFREEIRLHRNRRLVRVIDGAHLDFDRLWKHRVEAARRATNRETVRGLRLMFEAVAGRRCLAEIFGEAYEMAPPAAGLGRPVVTVSLSCGGCSACRRAGRPPYAGGMPTPSPAWATLPQPLSTELRRLFAGIPVLSIFDRGVDDDTFAGRQRRERLVRWLVAGGMRNVVAQQQVLERLRPLLDGMPETLAFFSEEWTPHAMLPLPSLIIATEGRLPFGVLDSPGVQHAGDTARILWLAADQRDPAKPHCLLRETIRCPSYPLEEFCSRIGL